MFPNTPAWGHNNRSVAFRIPAASGPDTRIEHRVAGADASPHLVVAAVLAAVLHGITHKLEPSSPVDGRAQAGRHIRISARLVGHAGPHERLVRVGSVLSEALSRSLHPAQAGRARDAARGDLASGAGISMFDAAGMSQGSSTTAGREDAYAGTRPTPGFSTHIPAAAASAGRLASNSRSAPGKSTTQGSTRGTAPKFDAPEGRYAWLAVLFSWVSRRRHQQATRSRTSKLCMAAERTGAGRWVTA